MKIVISPMSALATKILKTLSIAIAPALLLSSSAQAIGTGFPTAQAAYQAAESCMSNFRALVAAAEAANGPEHGASTQAPNTPAPANPIADAHAQALQCLAPIMNWWFYNSWEKAHIYPYFLISGYENELKSAINFMADFAEATTALTGCRADHADPLRRAYCEDILIDWFGSYGIAKIENPDQFFGQLGTEIYNSGMEADQASYQMPEANEAQISAKIDRMTDIVNWWWDRGGNFVPDSVTDENYMFKKVISLETDQMRMDPTNWDVATNIAWLDFSIDVNEMGSGQIHDFTNTTLDVYHKYLLGHEQDYNFYASFAPQLYPIVNHLQYGSLETKKRYLQTIEEMVSKEKELWNGFATLAQNYIENFDAAAYSLGLWTQEAYDADEPLRVAHNPLFIQHGLKNLANALRQRDMMEMGTHYFRIDDVFLKTDPASRAYRASHTQPGIIDYPDTVQSFQELAQWAAKPITEKVRRPFPAGPVAH